MLKKLTNKKGFTLMEMLIVVAIIAVLVAIAIPTFNGALTKAKEATDVANIRAAYADWQVSILTDNEALPKSDTEFKAKMTGGLQGKGTLTVTPDNATNPTKVTITYVATKLQANDGTNTFTWTLNPLDIK